MNSLSTRLSKALEFDGKAVAAEIDDCWPKEPDDAEISNEDALRLLAYIVHWNHQRYAPIHERLIACVEALGMVDAVGMEDAYARIVKEALTALSEVLSGKGDE